MLTRVLLLTNFEVLSTVLFAVVDVETTGGHASGHGMTEIAIVIHDGMKVVDEYSTLLNPGQPIPLSIQTLTGITPDMVEDAPTFAEVADEIQQFLGGHIFVAHNVNFDYGFVKNAFASVGVDYNPKRLCTVRYSRRIEGGLRSYSLKNLCKHFNVSNEAAHRAYGDARATAQILGLLLEQDVKGIWQHVIKKNAGEFYLPANLPAEQYLNLPESPGVYYFKDKGGTAIYIGKARNLKKRVSSHFIADKASKRSQAFKREIYQIDFELTGSELLASLLEDHEIRQYWPKYNRAQKNPKVRFGVYAYQNRGGRWSLAVNKITTQQGYLMQFYSRHEAMSWVFDKVKEYGLEPAHCGFPGSELEGQHNADEHNTAVEKLIKDVSDYHENYLIKTSGRNAEEDGFAYVENGYLSGIGFVPKDHQVNSLEDILSFVRALKSSTTTHSIIHKTLQNGRYPIQTI